MTNEFGGGSMEKEEIAQKIVEICENDAAFCKDIKVDPKGFLSEISSDADDKSFLFSVDRYLAAFGVRGHLYFYRKDSVPQIGFRVRKYKNSLFVTNVNPELSLLLGDEIVALDGLPIPQVEKKYAGFFPEKAERCGEIFEKIISYSKFFTVKRGTELEFPVRTDLKPMQNRPFRAVVLNRDCLALKFDHFSDEGEMRRFLESAEAKICAFRYLLIDVRAHRGGNDTVFLPLLKYCLKEQDIFCDKPIFFADEDVLYTEFNVENRIRIFEDALKGGAIKESRRFFEEEIEFLRKNRGKGFLPQREDGFRFPKRGTRFPEKVVLLIDENCGSSGESFVQIASRLEKVTLIGRPTMGICDYSNLSYFDFGEYVLFYPTSRSRAIDRGEGMRGRGVLPDIFVPWSLKHFEKDVDVSIALRFFSGEI